MQILSIQNNNYSRKESFKAYTPQQICADLCKGACCNHGTMMNGTLKKISDILCTQYKKTPDDLKSKMLIKTPIVKWIVNSQNPNVISLNNLANTYIDAISKETDTKIIKQLEEKLALINDKLCKLLGDNEKFCAVTNPESVNLSDYEIATSAKNICMYKDHDKTNLCTIYHGVKDAEGKNIGRPHACLVVGSDELPCPWHHPEKYSEICSKTRQTFANVGYGMLPMNVIQQYVAQQYNLNEVFFKKIWEPYINKTNTNM